MDRQLIAQYRSGAELPAQAIVGLSPAQLNAHPIPGTWSIQEIVLHLMDSDLIGSDRMKRVIAEDHPTIVAYDESKFAARLFYAQLDVRAACDIFRLNRLMTSEILERLSDEAFERSGQHNEAGIVTLAGLVRTYVEHLAHHLHFVRKKREMLTN